MTGETAFSSLTSIDRRRIAARSAFESTAGACAVATVVGSIACGICSRSVHCLNWTAVLERTGVGRNAEDHVCTKGGNEEGVDGREVHFLRRRLVVEFVWV